MYWIKYSQDEHKQNKDNANHQVGRLTLTKVKLNKEPIPHTLHFEFPHKGII